MTLSHTHTYKHTQKKQLLLLNINLNIAESVKFFWHHHIFFKNNVPKLKYSQQIKKILHQKIKELYKNFYINSEGN